MAVKRKKTFSIEVPHLLAWAIIALLLVWFLGAIQPILLPFVVGILMAYLFDPMADRLVKRGMSRGVAAAAITLGFIAILVALVVWLGPLLYHQLADLVRQLPSLLAAVEAYVRQHAAPLLEELDVLTNGHAKAAVASSPSEVIAKAVAIGNEVIGSAVGSSMAFINVLSLLLITPIVSFYLLRDWDVMIASLDDLLPRGHAAVIRAQAREVSRVLSGYLRGQLYVVLILAMLYAVTLSIVGLNYAILIGVLAGIMVLIPYVGTWVSALVAAVVAYSQFGVEAHFWAVIVVFVIGNTLESQVIVPKIIGDRVGLHPLWLLFGMLAGAVLLGFVGVLLAVPLTAVISVGVRFAVSLYRESSLYHDE
jgi:predicted PurR-regulated permease PerM